MDDRVDSLRPDPEYAPSARPGNAAASRLRALPQVQRLLETPEAYALAAHHSRAAVTAALRTALSEARDRVRRSDDAAPPGTTGLLDRAAEILAARSRPGLRRVINATGIVLHTNLGRAPLATEALDAIADAACGYANLEFDLDCGGRGPRAASLDGLLRALTGAEATLVVNNNAAAVLLALTATASGGEVIVSRGELVEIGGGFRIPDVISQGGARLVEVGTTNKTRLSDYRAAITPHTRALLRVHPSNYRITGFTAAPALADLAALAQETGLPLIEDLGSGTLLDLCALGRPHEPTVRESVAAGADLVCFSGDKLLGGPQAGLIVGTEQAVAPLRRHPLMRALRADKLCLAALEATLGLHLDPDTAAARIPALRMLGQDEATLQARAERLQAALAAAGAEVRIEPASAFAGGGSLPTSELPTRLVTLTLPGLSADILARRLRLRRPAIVGRITAGRLALDTLTVADDEVGLIAHAVQAVAAPCE